MISDYKKALILAPVFLFLLMAFIPNHGRVFDSSPQRLYIASIPQVAHFQAAVEDSRHGTPVILVTNGRSGSSYTSAIIKSSPKVFHFFEPLFPLAMQSLDSYAGNRTYDYHIWNDNISKTATHWINEFLSCRPSQVNKLNNTQFFLREHTHEMHKCLTDQTKTGWQHLDCYLRMLNNCRSHDTIFIKTVRFRLKWTQDVLAKFPNLKVLYLVRDPRAVLHSQSRVWGKHWFDWHTQIDDVARTYCEGVADDIRVFRQLKATYPQQFKLIRYEDGALQPENFARDIFSFLHFNFTQDIKDKVIEMTSGNSKKKDTNYSTHRANPEYDVQKWRFSAGLNQSRNVDVNCGDVYSLLGYRRIDSLEDLVGNKSFVLDLDRHSGLF